MSKQISDLENNNWIRDRAKLWGALLLLAAKLHQESCTDIDKFVWRLYVSYKPLNSVTRSFEFTIPRCSDSIKDLGNLYGRLFFITLDARSGYHQILARECDQEKLAFYFRRKKIIVLLLYLLDLKIHLHFTPP